MKFSQDWFTHNIPAFTHCMSLLPSKQEFLEIGCFEGRATCWMLKHALDSDGRITCIDTFEGGEEHAKHGVDFTGLRRQFEDNIQEAKGENQYVKVIQDVSYNGLAELIAKGSEFDFIYIDGSHIAKDVLTDACMAWPLLKQGGILVFDDYMWGNPRDILHRPKPAIDAFVNLFAEEVDMVHMGYQLIVRKK